LVGSVPSAEKMKITKDNVRCGMQKSSPRLVLGKNNSVGNAIICLEGITEGKKIDRDDTCSVKQLKCEYFPHITILPQGVQLDIVNVDPILHNVHAYDNAHGFQTAFNIAQPIRGQRTTVKQTAITKCGAEISLTCDAGHPWMSGYIFSAPHPYFAVTDNEGRYKLENIPPGSYKIKMWHEGVAVINKETENDKVKKYIYEEPYIVENEAVVPPNGKITLDFDLKLR
jgi:hypothetical protein